MCDPHPLCGSLVPGGVLASWGVVAAPTPCLPLSPVPRWQLPACKPGLGCGGAGALAAPSPPLSANVPCTWPPLLTCYAPALLPATPQADGPFLPRPGIHTAWHSRTCRALAPPHSCTGPTGPGGQGGGATLGLCRCLALPRHILVERSGAWLRNSKLKTQVPSFQLRVFALQFHHAALYT